jgi:predicted transcriptional regulator
MDIQLEKLEIIKQLLETNDETIIASIKKVFTREPKDWWDDLTEEQKAEIEESERQIERGEFVLYDEFMKKYR